MIKRFIFYNSDEIENRLAFYKPFSTFWNIFGGLCTHFFIHGHWGKRWLKIIFVVKSKVKQPQPKCKSRNLQNFNKANITQEHSLKPKTNWNFKVLLGLIISTVSITQLNSLFVFFWVQQQPWHSNVMPDKDLNLFDEYSAECVHVCPQKEERTFSSWGTVKVDTWHHSKFIESAN